MNGQTGASVLGGGVACQPGEGVVLLENKSAEGGWCCLASLEIFFFFFLDVQSVRRRSLPEHIRSVVRVQWVGVLTVQELVRLDRRHVQVQGGLGEEMMGKEIRSRVCCDISSTLTINESLFKFKHLGCILILV